MSKQTVKMPDVLPTQVQNKVQDKDYSKDQTLKFLRWLSARVERIALENEQIKQGIEELKEIVKNGPDF